MNNNKRRRSLPIWIMMLLFIAALTSPLAADEISSETCLECHEEMGASLQMTVHAPADASTSKAALVSCMDCHSGAEAHIEDPSAETIGNPARMSGAENFDLCNTCHTGHIGFNDFGFAAHFNEQVNCNECHKVHANNPALLRDRSGVFCIACHDDKSAELFMTSSHPVMDNGPSCLSCHANSTQPDSKLGFDLNQICANCHPEQCGPFLYEHDPVNAFSIEGSGCITCHQPHGSSNDRLLAQPGDNLCNSCHITPPLHRMAHGGWFADLQCGDCHTQTHGSFTSNLFLAEDLPARFDIGMGSCYQSGCHSLNK